MSYAVLNLLAVLPEPCHPIYLSQVLGETEVKAQIKLRLCTQTGAPIVVVRSFQVGQPSQLIHARAPAFCEAAAVTGNVLVRAQLTQKKAALQFKALDQVIQSFNKDTGAKEALSYRCADADRMIPNIMGVSKVCTVCLQVMQARACVKAVQLVLPASYRFPRLHAFAMYLVCILIGEHISSGK